MGCLGCLHLPTKERAWPLSGSIIAPGNSSTVVFTLTHSVPSGDSSIASTEGLSGSTGTNICSYPQLVGC